MQNLSPTMNILLKAIRKASRGVSRDFGEVENLQISQKAPGNFVTASDLKAEEILVEELKKARPEYGFLLEEGGEIKGKSEEYRWIIDPIDGTTNFIHGLPYFCITVALEKKQPNGKAEIVAAVTYNPVAKEIFMAEKGQGVWFEGVESSRTSRLRVSGRKKMIDCILCVGSVKDMLANTEIKPTDFSGVRCIGSTALALAYVAAGKFDCFIQRGVKAWDVAAGLLFIREAGGRVSDFAGGDDIFAKGEIVASNENMYDSLMKKISR